MGLGLGLTKNIAKGLSKDGGRVMTNREAIAQLKEINREAHIYSEAVEMAISALEKQIPKELIAEGDGYADGEMVYDSFYCPSCDHRMEEDEVEDYCPNCGQKICWEYE